MSLTVGKLKLMLERLLRVKAAQQALLLVPPETSGAQVGGGVGRAGWAAVLECRGCRLLLTADCCAVVQPAVSQ